MAKRYIVVSEKGDVGTFNAHGSLPGKDPAFLHACALAQSVADDERCRVVVVEELDSHRKQLAVFGDDAYSSAMRNC